ncbi:MAG: DUF1173 domain-containing protein [Ideonella sp.]|nr:DUF1173 domain-containing protein [Ideonella sp.]
MEQTSYLVEGRVLYPDAPEFADAIAHAHSERLRPKCMCQTGGIDMYVARLGETYIVKRMPDSGSRHAPQCPHYAPPAEFSGVAPLLGTAIIENVATGDTTLRLGFAMARMTGRSSQPTPGDGGDSATSDGARVSLRSLLHYLWDRAELTHWRPGFAGKRSWATVRRHLLDAAEHLIVRGERMLGRLYIPEPFSAEHRNAIRERRLACWARAVARNQGAQSLMLLIGEVKEIAAARYGHRMLVKHVPDQAFAIDEQLYRRLQHRFESELDLWGTSDDLRLVTAATFALSESGLPSIAQMSLLTVSAQWLPVEDAFELNLVDQMVRTERWFIKGLRYGLSRSEVLTNATLIDAGSQPVAMRILRAVNADITPVKADPWDQSAHWLWRVADGPMPILPSPAVRSSTGSRPAR